MYVDVWNTLWIMDAVGPICNIQWDEKGKPRKRKTPNPKITRKLINEAINFQHPFLDRQSIS
jgi:hypothetical protein